MSKELGILVIVVLKGQHLIDNHTFYKQDPYVKLSLSGATKQTPVDPKGGQHPVWDAEVRFPISKDPSKSNRTLTLSVFSEEKKDDELLGEGTVDITETLKSGEFDGASHFSSSAHVAAGSTSGIDWVPLSLKGTQRGDVYLEMTFFAAGPAPLSRRPSKFTNPAERLARPQQSPIAQRPQRVVSHPIPSGLSPGGQAPQPNSPISNESSRQGRPRIQQQVPLPGPWPGPSAQQRQSTQPPGSSPPNRRSSKSEDAPLPPLPPNATPPKEEFVPSILRPGGPSHTGFVGSPLTPIPNGTTGHHHTMPNDSAANTAYPPRHHTVHQTTLPFSGSPVPQAHIHSSSPQPQAQPQPPAQPHSPHLASYSTQGTTEHIGGYSQGGHATTQPSLQAQPEVSHTQYHSQSHTPPQLHQQVQHNPGQQVQPQGGPLDHYGSPYPTDNHPAQPYFPTPRPPSPSQSYFPASSPRPPPQPYGSPQVPSLPAPSYTTVQSPPVPHARPHAANTSPVPSARPHSTSPGPGPGVSVPPTHQYGTTPGPVPPTQPYASTPPPSAPPYTAPGNSVPLGQSYSPPTGSVLSPPPQSATPSSHVSPYFSTPNLAFPLPTSPPPLPPHHPTYVSPPTPPPPLPPHHPAYAPPPAPSFFVPSFPVPQSPAYFESVTPAPFSPPTEPDFPDPYLRRRYQAPLPLPPGPSQPPPRRISPDTRPEPTIPHLAAPASSRMRRAEDEDERAAREWQRLEEEDARARREQEERDEELARTLDLELNMGGGGSGGAQDEYGRPSHSQLPPLSKGVVRNSSVGEW